MAKEKKTQETRKCLNEGLSKSIRELVAQDPEDVVRHLMASDMDYWEAVKNEIVYPFLGPGSGPVLGIYGRCRQRRCRIF